MTNLEGGYSVAGLIVDSCFVKNQFNQIVCSDNGFLFERSLILDTKGVV